MKNIEKLIENRLSFLSDKPSIDNPPVVVLSHGFGVDKNEVGDFFVKLSENLSENGIFCIRFDFSGWGNSKGELSGTCIESQLNDLNSVINYLISSQLIDINNINLCGFSLGAAISTLCTKNNKIKNLALISPVGNLLEDFKLALGDSFFEQLESLQNNEPIHIPLPWRDDVTLSKKFFNSLSDYDTYEILRDFSGNIFSIAGENDFSAHHVKYFKDNCKGRNNHHEIIKNQDHTFNAYNQNSKIDEIVEKTSQWLISNINR